jgi:hypothetical protein
MITIYAIDADHRHIDHERPRLRAVVDARAARKQVRAATI